MNAWPAIRALSQWRKTIAAILLLISLVAARVFWQWHHLRAELERPRPESIRLESFKPFAGRRIGSNDVASFLLSRVALLLPLAQTRTTAISPGSQEQVFSGELSGCAVAIDPRGYFLTAAHCVSSGTNNLRLLFFGPDTNGNWSVIHTVAWPLVVWRGDLRHGGPDLAILRLNSGSQPTFAFADAVQTNQPVMAVGLRWTAGNVHGLELLGGRVLTLPKHNATAEVSIVDTDVPLQPGDSGGALVDTEGRLIGINVGRDAPVTIWGTPKQPSFGTTVRPDSKWLAGIIETDFAAHPRR